MMIALPNPDRTFTATLFWPFDGPAGFAGLDDRGRGRGPGSSATIPTPRPLFEDLDGEFAAQPGRHARHRADVAVDPRPPGPARRRRPRHRPLLRPGHELRLRGRRRARPLPRRDRRRLGPRRCRATPSGASPTPTPSPTSPSTTSSRCATGSARRRSGSASGSSTPSSGCAPDRFESLYELVSFTTVPYAEARRRAAAQRRFPANVAAVAAAGAALVARPWSA